MANIPDPQKELKKWRKRFLNFLPEGLEREIGPAVMEGVHSGVKKKDGKIVVRAKLPGYSRKDIDVDVTEGRISISAERKEEREKKKKGAYSRTRKSSSFSRVLALPEPVDPKSARAEYRNGVLEVTLKAKASKKGKRVKIK